MQEVELKWAAPIQVGIAPGKFELEFWGMNLTLPLVGASRLLELLSPYVPDDFIAGICPRHFTGGRRHALSAAQVWRTHLLAVLSSSHSVNLLVKQLSEQGEWRRFARLRHTLPTARMLHEFRQAMGVVPVVGLGKAR